LSNRIAVKIYTKTGDNGETGLFSGERVPKDHLLVCAYGTLDELNSQLGVVLAAQPHEEVAVLVHRLQSLLFDAGADLATRLEGRAVRRIDAHDVADLEKRMDLLQERLPSLKNFILPGGTPAAAQLQLARAIARRAERETFSAQRDFPLNPALLLFLNRLSDYLFLVGRLENHLAGVTETKWEPRPQD
jgi:cob(I)alamin adenosyltransferase